MIKGLIIGIGKIIPGVSGSLLAILLGVYEECLNCISHFFKDIKYHFYYLGFLGIGILSSIIFGSRILLFFLNHHYFYTMFFILGLLLGILPNLLKEVKINKKKEFLFLIVPLIFLYLLETFQNTKIFVPSDTFSSYISIFFMGFIEALTMIIPGISGTATFMILGCYDFVLSSFSNPFSIYFFIFFIGVFLGIIIVSIFMSYLFQKCEHKLYLMITSFTVGSLFFLLKDVFFSYQSENILFTIFLFLMGYFISHFFNK